MAHDVFISYSSLDKPVADAACSTLEAGGVRCWIAPRDVLPGTEYAAALIEAINSSALLVLILSSNSNQSPQVLREVERAVSKGLPIVPFRVEDVQLTSSMEYYVSTQHWLDAINPPLEKHLQKLTATVRLLLDSGREQSERGGASRPISQVFEAEKSALASDMLTEDDYGGGSELSTTGFLVFGLLTAWIYTVWAYHRILADHLASRLASLRKSLEEKVGPGRAPAALADIERKGFSIGGRIKYACSGMFGACLILLILVVGSQFLYMAQVIKEDTFNELTIAGTFAAALLFGAASVWFMTWAGGRIKAHEYQELLLVALIRNPADFKPVRPSDAWTKRWNRNQNLIAFFLVLAVPMALSPGFGVYHVYQIIQARGDYQTAIMIWTGVIFFFAAVFHLWGTKLLLDFYNQHLRFEAENREKR